MDRETVERLVAEWPEGYRGGRIDRARPVGRMVSPDKAWKNAERCLEDDNGPRAAYWAGFATGGET